MAFLEAEDQRPSALRPVRLITSSIVIGGTSAEADPEDGEAGLDQMVHDHLPTKGRPPPAMLSAIWRWSAKCWS